MSAANSNTDEQAGAEDPAFEQFRKNDAFQDMVVRAAEQMVLDAPLDDLVRFAYGSWPEAQAAWEQFQRSRFRRPRRARSGRAA